MSDGAFRQDLYYRLARYTVTAPPLREHREDIPLLARHFLRLFAVEMGREAPPLKQETVDALGDHDFPGNVRELKNIIERALIESRGEEIEAHHLRFGSIEGPGSVSTSATAPQTPDLPLDLDKAAQRAEMWVVERALEQTGGNLSEAARLLGTSRNRIYRITDKTQRDR